MARTRLSFCSLALLLAVAVIAVRAQLHGDVEGDKNVPSLADAELHTNDDEPHSAPTTATTTKPVLKIQDEKPFSPPQLTDETFYLYEPFRTADLLDKSFHFRNASRRWYLSTAKKDGVEEALAKYEGQWKIEEAKLAHLKNDLGLVVKSKAKHHAIATKLAKPFDFGDGKPLVLQFDLKFQEGQDCGGGYVKLLSSGQEQDLHLFMDKTPFTIMFGPDKCGLDSKLHFILKLRNPVTGEIEEKKASQPKDKIEKFITDKLTHLYTLVLQPDNKFSVYIDQKQVHSGSLLKDLEPPINPPKEIKDPNAVKPTEWDDREMITDETDVKPANWIDERLIPDPKAEKPEDWDDEMDGVWEAPKIDNPNFKGEWRAKQIKNPSYSGVWKQPMIPNPAYFENSKPFQSLAPINAVGIELWTMSSDIMFDNFIITSDKKLADRLAKETWALKAERERAAEGITTASAMSTVSNWYDYAKSHPWVWGLFLLGLGIPIVFIIMSLAKRSRESSAGRGSRTGDKLQREGATRRTKPTGSENEESDDEHADDNRRQNDEEDDDELIGNDAGSSRTQSTTQSGQTGRDLLRSASPSSSSRRQTSQRTQQSSAAASTPQTRTTDSPPPELESAESGDDDHDEQTTGRAEVDGDNYEEEDEELLANTDEPPAEAADKANKANKVTFEQVTTTKTTTVEQRMPEANADVDAAGAASNLRSRARRPRREE